MWTESIHSVLVLVGLEGRSSLLLSGVWGFSLYWLQQYPGGSIPQSIPAGPGPPSRTVSDTVGFALPQGSTKA